MRSGGSVSNQMPTAGPEQRQRRMFSLHRYESRPGLRRNTGEREPGPGRTRPPRNPENSSSISPSVFGTVDSTTRIASAVWSAARDFDDVLKRNASHRSPRTRVRPNGRVRVSYNAGSVRRSRVSPCGTSGTRQQRRTSLPRRTGEPEEDLVPLVVVEPVHQTVPMLMSAPSFRDGNELHPEPGDGHLEADIVKDLDHLVEVIQPG